MTDSSKRCVRWTIRLDIAELAALDGGPDAWTAEDWAEATSQRDIVGNVAEREGFGTPVTAGVCYRLMRRRLEVLHLIGDRQGVEALVNKLAEKVDATHTRKAVRMTVRETDYPTVALLARHGWRALRVIRGAFGECDGYRMEYRAPAIAPETSRLVTPF